MIISAYYIPLYLYIIEEHLSLKNMCIIYAHRVIGLVTLFLTDGVNSK